MPRRHLSRECALQVLYLVDAGGAETPAALCAYWSDFPRELDVRDYAESLVHGVADRRADIDAVIERRSVNWRVARMAIVDRNILRLAVYEMLCSPDVPQKVAIDEAIELAKKFGSEDSRAFVNGVLDGVMQDLKAAKAAAAAPARAPAAAPPAAAPVADAPAVADETPPPPKKAGGDAPPRRRVVPAKPAPRKAPARKPAAKEPPVKSPAAKRPAAKKPAAKKPAAKRPAGKAPRK
jgi:N utilization substance protein B